LEEHKDELRVKRGRRKYLPEHVAVTPSGVEQVDGQGVALLPGQFVFCLRCGVSYAPGQSDFGKLASLSSEGRSSATTVLSLSAIENLRKSGLEQQAQKLLSFTDNRQDASLQ